MNPAEKTCSSCGESKSLDKFYRRRDMKLGRYGQCKECMREMLSTNGARRDEKGRRRLHKVKDAPCADCGGRFPACAMDFDHIRGEKYRELSKMLRVSDEVFFAEIAKCELVCANCHRVRTYKRNQENPRGRRAGRKENP